MNSQSDEQQVLNGIESQLRTEDPQLIASFLAFNSVTPPIKPLTGCYRSTPRTEHRRADRLAKAGTAELVLFAIAFVMFAVLVAALVWAPGLLA